MFYEFVFAKTQIVKYVYILFHVKIAPTNILPSTTKSFIQKHPSAPLKEGEPFPLFTSTIRLSFCCGFSNAVHVWRVTADMGQRWVAASAFIVRQIVNADIWGPGSLVMEGLTSLKLGSRAHRASSGSGPVGPGNEGRSCRLGPPSLTKGSWDCRFCFAITTSLALVRQLLMSVMWPHQNRRKTYQLIESRMLYFLIELISKNICIILHIFYPLSEKHLLDS